MRDEGFHGMWSFTRLQIGRDAVTDVAKILVLGEGGWRRHKIIIIISFFYFWLTLLNNTVISCVFYHIKLKITNHTLYMWNRRTHPLPPFGRHKNYLIRTWCQNLYQLQQNEWFSHFIPLVIQFVCLFIGVLRHMQQSFSRICDGTHVQADWRSCCTYCWAPNAIDISQCSLTYPFYTDTGPTFLYGDSDTPPL